MRFNTLENWLAWLESFHPKEIDLGLKRVKDVYQSLGSFDNKPLTITVAGTNGKGSSVAMLCSIFRAEGYRVGAYTSPHLLKYNERIQINNKAADAQDICEAFEHVDQARGSTSLTYFEFGTLAALDIFRRSQIDIQLLEVGLGGRLDAVNIVDPDIALVTTAALDHCDWLGDSRESIGFEKAGIFRNNIPAIVGDRNPPKSLLRYGQEIGVRFSRSGQDFNFERSGSGWTWQGNGNVISNLPLPKLHGNQQLANAAVVLQAIHLARKEKPVSAHSIRKGLSTVNLAGRFQLVSEVKPEVLLDVAHNPQAASALAQSLKQMFPNRNIHAVFSIMGDKDIEGVLSPMKSVINRWYVSPLDMPRVASEHDINKAFTACSIAPCGHRFTNFETAFEAAIQDCTDNDLIVIFGSFFLVAKYLALSQGRINECSEPESG